MPGLFPSSSHDPSWRAPPSAARRLVAVPWRQAGLIALCTFVGAALSTLASLRHPTGGGGPAAARAQTSLRTPAPAGDAGRLRLALELETAVVRDDIAMLVEGTGALATALRMDDAREPDAIDAALRLAPPAAGRVSDDAPVRVAPDGRGHGAWPGLLAGLLLGLALAALRELRGQRMRSPREAEWALGVPVLGAIPTLPTRSRESRFGMPGPGPDRSPVDRA